jgi:hypothetical protein
MYTELGQMRGGIDRLQHLVHHIVLALETPERQIGDRECHTVTRGLMMTAHMCVDVPDPAIGFSATAATTEHMITNRLQNTP